jgi:uncharacterized protein HemY
VYLGKGDRAVYQAACHEALKKLRSERDPEEQAILLWMCTVTPYSVAEPDRLADAAEAVLTSSQDEPSRDQLLAAGAAFYRAGEYDEARKPLKQTLRCAAEAQPTVDPMSEVFAHQFLAMTHARLGRTQEASASFAESQRRAQHITPPCWVSKLQHKLLTEEARATINGADQPDG